MKSSLGRGPGTAKALNDRDDAAVECRDRGELMLPLDRAVHVLKDRSGAVDEAESAVMADEVLREPVVVEIGHRQGRRLSL